MRKIITSVLVILLVVVCVLYFLNKPNIAPEVIVDQSNNLTDDTNFVPTLASDQIAVYENIDFGFKFKYRIKPYGYSVYNSTDEERYNIGSIFGVNFLRSEDYNSLERAKAEGIAYDGPPSISVNVFSASKVLNLPDWMVGNEKFTNCVDGSVVATSFSGLDAYSCLWNGLYSGVTIALSSNNKIFVLTGTREESEDNFGYSYKKDFEDIVSTFELIK
jgi:hypothetical protein